MFRFACVLGAALLVAGCGTTPTDRTVSGAGIGAAGGAAVGALTGLTVLEGAAIGAVVGGVTGFFTDPEKVNLGSPPWSTSETPGEPQASLAPASPPQASPPPVAATTDADLVRRTQADLKRLGYDPGPVDGVLGPRTRGAIAAYQKDYGLATDGRPTPRLAAALRERADKQAALRAALF